MFQWVFGVPPQLILLVLFVSLLLACVSWGQPRAFLALSQGQGYYLPVYDLTPEDFYTRLFGELRDRLADRPLPLSPVSFGSKHLFARRTALSARPVYLMLKYREFRYYFYATPAPGGVYVNSWLFSKYALWEDHPLLRWVLVWRLFQQTLFQADTLSLFHGVVYTTFLDVVDSYRTEQGLQPLEEEERRPVLRSYFARLKYGDAPPVGYAQPIQSPGTARPAIPAVPIPESPSTSPSTSPGVFPIQTDPLPQTFS